MDDTSLNAHPSRIPSHAPFLSTFQLEALRRRTSLIQTTINKCFKDDSAWYWTRIGKKVLIELIKDGHLWIFVEGDEGYCLTNDPTMNFDSEAKEEWQLSPQDVEEWQLSPQDVDTVKQMLEPDGALLAQASQTTPAMRIGMIIWLVITSLAIQDSFPRKYQSAWDKWDFQGRAITIWADIYSEIIRSKKRPSEAIPTDENAVAAFKSAMEIAGHHHDYQATPDLGAWTTMRAALFPELKDTELACWHFNNRDGCSLCDERFREKLQSETGLDHLPPLHLVALWEYFGECEDFKERITFAVFQRPHLFLPEIVKPIEELLAQHFPQKARRTYGLHYKLSEHDPMVNWRNSLHAAAGMAPLWQKIQDTIDSLRCFAPSCRDHSFPPIKPIFWFDMVQVLGGQYQSQDEGKGESSRPRVNLAVAYRLDDEVLGEEFPHLNLDLLPEYVQRAVKQFCQATECEGHSCETYDNYSDSWQTWGHLEVEYRTRYAAAYALLYSTDIVPLLGDNNNNNNNNEICSTCDDIRLLYDCVDAISAGQITLGSENIAKVLGLIKELAVISNDCKFIFPEDRSDVDDSEDDSESSQRPDNQQHDGRSDNQEVIHNETRDNTLVAANEMHHFSATSFTLEASASSTTQMYQNFMTDDASLVQYMTEINDSAQEHVGEFNLSPPRCPECMSFRDVIPNSSLDEVGGSHLVPEANWESIEQPPQLVATSNVAGPSRPKDNLGLKIAKEAKKKELHAFFVTLFKKHGVPLGTTGMAEARLPWKKMTSILADQGLEIAGWPEGVPKPRSDGKADKGISGFNAEHIAALYKAMKAGQINFRLLAGGSPTNDASRVWQREDDMEEEVNIRPTKKRKLAETRKKPKDFVAMQSVMKF